MDNMDDTIFEKQRVRHHRLMDNIIKFHKNKNRKPNKWMNFVKFYSAMTGASIKQCMQDVECKTLYRLQYQ